MNSDSDLFDKMSDDPKLWKICDKDRYRQGTYRYSPKYCDKCNRKGHDRKKCPKRKKQCLLCGMHGHHIYRCPDRCCSICFKHGHLKDNCFNANTKCQICGLSGHITDYCSMNFKRFLTVTNMDIYEKHINCDVNSHDCDICSISKWNIRQPFSDINNTFTLNNQDVSITDSDDDSFSFTPKYDYKLVEDSKSKQSKRKCVNNHKPNSNLRPKNKKMTNISHTKKPVIRKPFSKFDSSDYSEDCDEFYSSLHHENLQDKNFSDRDDTKVRKANSIEQKNVLFECPRETVVQMSSDDDENKKEEESFWDMLKNSTKFNPEPFQKKKNKIQTIVESSKVKKKVNKKKKMNVKKKIETPKVVSSKNKKKRARKTSRRKNSKKNLN